MAAFLVSQGAWGQLVSLKMRPPVLPSGVADLGAVPASQPLKVTLYLAPTADRTASLLSFLAAVQTPGNPAYRQWLTPAAFGQQFGATSDQLAAVTAFAQTSGLSVESVSASGLRVVVSGSVAQIEAAMSPAIHTMQVGSATYYANTATPKLPSGVASNLLAVDGLNNMPATYPLSLATDGAALSASAAKDGLQSLGGIVEANSIRLLSLGTTACLEDVDVGTRAAMQLVLRQASAQGIIVLAETGCGARGSAGFPSIFSEATSVAIAPGITPPAAANLTEARPWWQLALGLPADGLRHEPDVTVSGLNAFATTMMSILANEPPASDGSPARLGNINPTLYEMSADPGLYTQPDSAPGGTWEAPTGLGLVDLQKLADFFPRGSLSTNTSIAVSNGGYVTHGMALTFSSNVTDTSGQGGGVAPTGTVVFSTSTGVALGSATLSGGSASVSYNALPGGTYSVTAAYSGDTTYAASTSVTAGFTVGPEAAQVTAIAGSAVVGGTSSVVITVKSLSGVGTPSGAVTVIPQGTADTTTYTGTLSGSGGTATATVAVDAVQGGADVFKANCTTGTTFTCYSPVNVTAQISLGTPRMALTASPATVVTGTTETLTATLSGNGTPYPTPAGNVDFYDNGTNLGPATLNNGVATYQKTGLLGTATHSFSATYDGDNNYGTVSATANSSAAASATSLALTISPNPPVSGSTTTLTATLTYTLTNNTAPTGSVSFFEDGAQIGSGTLSGAVATFSSTTLSSSIGHTFFAVYTADANYQTSTSPTITTSTTGATTTTTLAISPNPPVSGSTTTLSATIAYTANGLTPTGTMKFYEDGTLLSSVTVTSLVATYSSTTLSGTAAHTFYAVYSGDANFKTSTSTTLATAASSTGTTATTTALLVSPNPPVGGSATVLSATVSHATGSATPTGTVTFYEDGVALGAANVSGIATASYTSSTITGTTTHTFTAIYSGDSTYATSTSPAVTATPSTSTGTATSYSSLTVSPDPPVSGNTTTLMATVIGSFGSGLPAGTVTFYEDGTSIGSSPLINQGTTLNGFMVATLTSTTITGTAAHTFSATYAGNTVYAGSNSTAVATTASGSLQASGLTLALSPNPPVAGSTATLTATIATTGTVTPTGTITLYYDDPPGGLPLNVVTVTGKTVTLSSGNGSLFLGNLYNAVYSGDSNYAGSTSQNLTPQASQVSTTLTAAVASTTVATGGTDVLTATIAPASTLSTAPTGTITFSSAQGTLCSGTVTSTTFSCTATLTTTGTQTITASYTGDTNYLASTSTNAPTVTVGSTTAGTGVLTASASPSASVMYGNTVTLSSTLTSSVTGGPAGTVTFSVAGTTTATYTAALVSNGSTAATATYAIPTPAPGTYVVTATCTSSNVTCTTLSATASLTVIKGATTTTLTASPTGPLVGQTTVFTATVAPASTSVNAAALAPTGTVTFYVNGTSVSEALVNGIATYSTVLTATTGNYVTAVYSGDTNWNGSTSSQLIVNIAPIVTTSSLSANQTNALYTANIILTDSVLVAPTATNPNPGSPGGYVTFYDLYNGQTVLLGNANVTALIAGQSVAQLSTTGLMKGTHTITALYNANTTYASSTGTIIININDYGLSFSPTYLSLTAGSGGASIATITAYNGFSGQVVLACQPPAGTGMTCSFTPAAITMAGTSVLSVTTTAPTAKMIRPAMPGRAATEITLAGVTLGTMLIGLLLPRSRRRPTLLVALLAAALLGLSVGCTTQGSIATPGSPTTGGKGGTPSGTQLLSITTQGTDGVTTVRHDVQFPVTIQ